MQDNDLKRQAYLDEQMSVDEIIDFETSLSPDEQKSLARERQYNRVLEDKCSEAPACPDALWQKLKKQMQEEDPTEIAEIAQSKGFIDWKIIALAALFVVNIIALSILFNRPVTVNEPPQLTQHPFIPDKTLFATPANFAAGSQPIEDFSALSSNLKEHNIKLSVNQPAGHHAIKPLGIRYHEIAGKQVVELYIECCSEPMYVIILPKGKQIDIPDSLNLKADAKLINDYQILTFSETHSTTEVSDLFTQL